MHSVTFSISDSFDTFSGTYTIYTPELAGKRITFSYMPVSSTDETLILTYGGYIFDVPAYLLNVKAVIKINGDVKLTLPSTTMGEVQTMTINFSKINRTESMRKTLITGTYYAIGIDLQGINETTLGSRNNILTTNVFSENVNSLDKDELLGEHLYALALTQFLATDKIYKAGAKLYNVIFIRTLSEAVVSMPLNISYLFGAPLNAIPSGMEMDIAMDRMIAISREGSKTKAKAFMDIAGLTGSYHEHDIFERIDGFSSISAVKAIQSANTNGITVYTINSTNISQLLPLLQVDSDIKTDIQNAVNAGREVTIPQKNVQINDWIGIGYIAINTITGAGAYMISGGVGGGRSTVLEDWEKFKQIYWQPGAWFNAMMDFIAGLYIAYFAIVQDGESDLNDEELENRIINGALICQGMGYNAVGKCTGLVARAYLSAGINLGELATKNGIGKPSLTYNLYALANKLNINHSVRTTNNPLKGDIIFWDYTYDRNGNCLLADDKQPTHVGIVTKVDIDGKGTLQFIHAARKGVSASDNNKMNITMPSDSNVNAFLRGNPRNGCPSDDASFGKLAGQLFRGYGTIRNK